jgi:hypothetical protein
MADLGYFWRTAPFEGPGSRGRSEYRGAKLAAHFPRASRVFFRAVLARHVFVASTLCFAQLSPAERSMVERELALRLKRRPKARKPRKRLWRGRGSGAEANSAHCGASTLRGDTCRSPIPSTPQSLPASSASTRSRYAPCYGCTTSCRAIARTWNTGFPEPLRLRFGTTLTCRHCPGARSAQAVRSI